jgi:hypothetical protein
MSSPEIIVIDDYQQYRVHQYEKRSAHLGPVLLSIRKQLNFDSLITCITLHMA